MISKTENLFNLTNYRDHPDNDNYKVFFHYNMEQGKHFQSLLDKEQIAYEFFLEEESKQTIMLFAVHKRDFRNALLQNDLSYAAFKKRFIPNSLLRNAILIITISFVLFAIIGYFMSH
jgi:hypothetical protein